MRITGLAKVHNIYIYIYTYSTVGTKKCSRLGSISSLCSPPGLPSWLENSMVVH